MIHHKQFPSLKQPQEVGQEFDEKEMHVGLSLHQELSLVL